MTKNKSSLPADEIVDIEDIDEITKDAKKTGQNQQASSPVRAHSGRRLATVSILLVCLIAGGLGFFAYQINKDQQAAFEAERQNLITAQARFETSTAQIMARLETQQSEITALAQAVDKQTSQIAQAVKIAGQAADQRPAAGYQPSHFVALMMYSAAKEGRPLSSYETVVAALPEGEAKNWLSEVITKTGALSEPDLIAKGLLLLADTSPSQIVIDDHPAADHNSVISWFGEFFADMIQLRSVEDADDAPQAAPAPVISEAPQQPLADLERLIERLSARADQPAQGWLAQASQWRAAMMTLEAFIAMMMSEANQQASGADVASGEGR